MIEFRRTVTTAALAAAVTATTLVGCTAKEGTKAEPTSGGGSQITVDANDSACTLSATSAGTGKRTFVITNNGTKVTEFYVYGPNNEVIEEVENISPGLQRSLDVEFAAPGKYRAACKPGMVGDGISADFTVTG